MDTLPNEVVLRIFNCLSSPEDLLNARLISHRWRALIDASLSSRRGSFWRDACLAFLGVFTCDALLADSSFDAFFLPTFARPSGDALCCLDDERLWRAVFSSHLRLQHCRHPASLRLVLPPAARVSEAVLHANFLLASAARHSVGCLLLAPLPSSAAGAEQVDLQPHVFHSAPGLFHGLAVMSGFPQLGCPELVGQQIASCPLCGESVASSMLAASAAAHVTVQAVHKYRGLELIGVCLRKKSALPPNTWWRQSLRPREDMTGIIASLHKSVSQVVFRRKENSYRHLYHLHGGCEGCSTHEAKILTSGLVLAAAATECCSAELFHRGQGDRSHRLQVSAVWGGSRGSGAYADDLRSGSGGDAAISASALLLQDPTCIVAFSRVTPGPQGIATWTHCLCERDLSRADRPRAASVPLGRLSPRLVQRMASKGPVTVLATDAGKVVVLRSPPEGLASAIARFHGGENDQLLIGTRATTGQPVTGLHMSLQPGEMRCAVCTLTNVVFLLLF